MHCCTGGASVPAPHVQKEELTKFRPGNVVQFRTRLRLSEKPTIGSVTFRWLNLCDYYLNFSSADYLVAQDDGKLLYVSPGASKRVPPRDDNSGPITDGSPGPSHVPTIEALTRIVSDFDALKLAASGADSSFDAAKKRNAAMLKFSDRLIGQKLTFHCRITDVNPDGTVALLPAEELRIASMRWYVSSFQLTADELKTVKVGDFLQIKGGISVRSNRSPLKVLLIKDELYIELTGVEHRVLKTKVK